METSTVEIKIQQFVLNYGAEQLICWLAHFDKVIKTKEYPLYRKLEKEACEACFISIADMHRVSNTPSTNTKRIISFIAFHQLGLKVPSIAKLLGLSDRTINYYIKETEEWINEPKGNKSFVESYNKVFENFKIT